VRLPANPKAHPSDWDSGQTVDAAFTNDCRKWLGVEVSALLNLARTFCMQRMT
jgi:hypothetical protein